MLLETTRHPQHLDRELEARADFEPSPVPHDDPAEGPCAIGATALKLVPGQHPERRRGLRIRQARPVKVFEPTGSRYFGGQTEDISATGLRVELPLSATVRPGRLVNIHVGLSAQGEALANRRQMMSARVVWISRDPRLGQGKLTAGIE